MLVTLWLLVGVVVAPVLVVVVVLVVFEQEHLL
jgi:hypothetical protein